MALTRLKSALESDDARVEEQHVPVTAWMVLDGISDASALLEPLMDIARALPSGDKRLVLPNGDQLRCDNADMRVFCEVESLQHWSPACLAHFGLVYLESDHVLPYTLLIKSWSQRETAQIQSAETTSSNNAFSIESVELTAKLMRSLVAPLLDVCKRNAKPFMEFSASHLVDKLLQLLSVLLREMAALGDSSKSAVHTTDVKAVVAYAMALSFGLFLQTKARVEFNALLVRLVPEVAEMLQQTFGDASSVTMFDVGLRFENHHATFVRWTTVASPPEAAASDAVDWHTRVFRRSSGVMSSKASGAVDAGNATLLPTLGGTASSAHLYVPTPQTISTEAWLTLLGSAKAHTLVFGDAAVGKSCLVRHCAQTLEHRERFVTTALELSSAVSARTIQSAVEAGLPRKLKALYCPGAGKKAMLITLENLNLEIEVRHYQCVHIVRLIVSSKLTCAILSTCV